MIVDTSALVAILFDEPGAAALARAIRQADQPKISAPTLVELFTVIEHRVSPAVRIRLNDVLARLHLEVVPFDLDHARLARDGYRAFGKGSGSAARLNYGDTFSYALAAVTGEPLLFVGDDFTHTDLRPALSPS